MYNAYKMWRDLIESRELDSEAVIQHIEHLYKSLVQNQINSNIFS